MVLFSSDYSRIGSYDRSLCEQVLSFTDVFRSEWKFTAFEELNPSLIFPVLHYRL